VDQTSLGVFGQSEIEWSSRLRMTAGLRGDLYRFRVTASDPANSGRDVEALLSPKFGMVLGPWASTEFYVNAGFGFHSNDARGATITRDPLSGEPAERVTPLARARGAEVGLRSVRLRGLQTTLSLWRLDLDSELLYVGDIGTTTATPPTLRYGVEFANYARLNRSVTLDADISFSRARFTAGEEEGGHVPGAVDRVISSGLTIEPVHRWFGGLRVRHFGPRALVADGSVRSDQTTIFNGEVGVRILPRARLVVEGFNLFDAKASDIDYFYTSRLPDEPAEGVDDRHTHPALPRTARVGLQFTF
jgi:outer membrane receptor protein involved in Fe transport